MKRFLLAITFLIIGMAQAQEKQAGVPTEAEKLKKAAMDAYEKKDYVTAAETIIKAVHLNDPEAMNILADLYSSGWGVPKNFKEAYHWYLKSAKLGNKSGEISAIHLGESLYKSREINKNELYEGLESLSAMGSAHAMLHLGQLYRGWGATDADKKKAIEYLTKSADMGYALSMLELGNLYYNDFDLKDYKLAENWYKRGAESGNGQAMYGLALLYEEKYKRKDKVVLDLYLGAAEKGNEEAMDKVLEAYKEGKFKAKKKSQEELMQLREKYNRIFEESMFRSVDGHW